MQKWASDGTRLERTGWRDQGISNRHRQWGFNCPCVDLDFLVAEYNVGKPVALVEYKHYMARQPTLDHATYRALSALADNYNEGGLPFLVAFYWPDIWAFRVLPVNEIAKKYFKPMEEFTEFEFVVKLYHLRRLTIAKELEGKLSKTPVPPDDSTQYNSN